jgi:hypothetical protein
MVRHIVRLCALPGRARRWFTRPPAEGSTFGYASPQTHWAIAHPHPLPHRLHPDEVDAPEVVRDPVR